MSEAHLAHVLGMYPQISNAEVCDISASVEVDFEEIWAGLGESGNGFVVNSLDVAELDPAEKVTVLGEGEHAVWRYCSTASEVDTLQAFACPREGGDGFVRRLDYAREVDSNEVGTG